MGKFIALVAGRRTEVSGLTVSAGAADAGKFFQTGPDGRWDASLMPVGIAADTAAIVASEALAAGDTVNVWNNAGVSNVRKADATAAGKETWGFVLASVAAAAVATVYFEGRITGKTGLTPGARYFTATTPGGVTATAPSAAGNVVQCIGQAISATEINFEPESDGGVIVG